MKIRSAIGNKKMNLEECLDTSQPLEITPETLYSILFPSAKRKVHSDHNEISEEKEEEKKIKVEGADNEEEQVSAASSPPAISKDKLLLIDVRDTDEHSLFSIKDSLNIPYQELNVRELFDKYAAGGYTMLFMSNCSPDVDDLAARNYIVEYEKRTRHAPRKNSVCILLGGLFNWRTYC